MNRRDFLFTTAAAAGAAFAPAWAEEPKLRVAVIGHTGRGNYGHGLDTMWAALPETEVVAVADADATGLAAAQAKLKLSRGYADYRQMLAEVKPDIVAIGPRAVGEHEAMAMAAAQTGAKGIYMEKPFAPTLRAADAIIAACEKSGTKLALAHRNRYQPVLPKIKEMLASNGLGKILEIRGRGKEDARGGCVDLWVLGSHVLNLATIFTGKPLACSATLLRDGKPATPADVTTGAEDLGPIAGNELHARFETESGIPLFFDSIKDAGRKEANFGLQIIAQGGIIDLRVDVTPLAHILYGNIHHPQPAKLLAWTPFTSTGVGDEEKIPNLAKLVSNHTLAGRDLIAAIRENRQPLCSMYEGRQGVEMITAVLASHVRGGARVGFPLQAPENPLSSWA